MSQATEFRDSINEQPSELSVVIYDVSTGHFLMTLLDQARFTSIGSNTKS